MLPSGTVAQADMPMGDVFAQDDYGYRPEEDVMYG
jgi:hypothetical protein